MANKEVIITIVIYNLVLIVVGLLTKNRNKTQDDFCMNVGKNIYNNLCKKHFNMENKQKEHNEKDCCSYQEWWCRDENG